jgi:hypothetical protein
MWELKNAPYFKCERLQDYDRIRTEYLDGPLEPLGFEQLPEEGDDLSVRWRDYVRSTTYLKRREDRSPLYILVTANQRHRDAPNHIEIRLGEGSAVLPEQRFNSIPLSTLVYCHAPKRQTGKAEYYGLYGVPAMAEFEAVFQRAAEDLLTHGIGFLHGRLEEFYELRRRENRLRSPYTYTWAHDLDESLQRRMADDAETKEALRQKYASYPEPFSVRDLTG